MLMANTNECSSLNNISWGQLRCSVVHSHRSSYRKHSVIATMKQIYILNPLKNYTSSPVRCWEKTREKRFTRHPFPDLQTPRLIWDENPWTRKRAVCWHFKEAPVFLRAAAQQWRKPHRNSYRLFIMVTHLVEPTPVAPWCWLLRTS